MAQSSEDEVKVTFFPPLYEQRRSWVLSVLRKERVSDIVDIGCGEGSLLGTLCNAPPHLNASSSFQAKEFAWEPSVFEQTLQQINFEAKIERIAGLDISESDLQDCLGVVKPRKHYSPVVGTGLLRWEKLEVDVYLGSLEDFNVRFVDVECIVATEVIEHLEPHTLSSFAPIILGRYRPQLLLVTTPSYVYNGRFSAPGEADPAGYPDPTGRTNRVFRHADHKFEWTPQEFTSWCSTEAEKYEYEVEISSVGRALEPDPWGRDDELGYATQVAIFRRKDGGKRGSRIDKRRSLRQDKDPDGVFYDQTVELQDQPCDVPAEKAGFANMSQTPHVLLAHYVHDAHPEAAHPECDIKIISKVNSALRQYYVEGGWSIWELWIIEEISIACGGYIDELLRVILNAGTFTLDMNCELYKSFTDWKVDFSDRELCRRLLTERASTRSEGEFGEFEETVQSESDSFAGEEDPWISTIDFGGGWSERTIYNQTSDGLPEDDLGWGRQIAQDGWGT